MRAFANYMLMRIALVAAILLVSCRAKPSVTNQGEGLNSQTQTYNTLSDYVHVGEERPVTASGPEYRLPETYYEFAKEHHDVAMQILQVKLKSNEPNIRLNAYDFILSLAEVPETRVESLRILRSAIDSEGFVTQQFVRPRYEQIVSKSPSTLPR